MPKVTVITKGFEHYGAKLVNRVWAVSALVDGAVVMNLWAHKFRKGMVYVDQVSRWTGPGNELFRKHLLQAIEEKRAILAVIATSSNPAAIDRGEEGAGAKTTYVVRPELIGKVESFDGDEFVIRFRNDGGLSQAE
jgi:hypothetical protein